MVTTHTFDFPGFVVSGNADNDKFQIDIGNFEEGGTTYTLNVGIPHNAPPHGHFSVMSVRIGSTTLWNFAQYKQDGVNPYLYSRLFMSEGGVAIILVGRTSGKIDDLTFLNDLGRGTPVNCWQLPGRRSPPGGTSTSR